MSGTEVLVVVPIVSVTRGDMRLIHPLTPLGADELYDLATDPGEQVNLAHGRPQDVERLLADVKVYLATEPASWGGATDVAIDALRLEQLRALGYLHDPRDEEKGG